MHVFPWNISLSHSGHSPRFTESSVIEFPLGTKNIRKGVSIVCNEDINHTIYSDLLSRMQGCAAPVTLHMIIKMLKGLGRWDRWDTHNKTPAGYECLFSFLTVAIQSITYSICMWTLIFRVWPFFPIGPPGIDDNGCVFPLVLSSVVVDAVSGS